MEIGHLCKKLVFLQEQRDALMKKKLLLQTRIEEIGTVDSKRGGTVQQPHPMQELADKEVPALTRMLQDLERECDEVRATLLEIARMPPKSSSSLTVGQENKPLEEGKGEDEGSSALVVMEEGEDSQNNSTNEVLAIDDGLPKPSTGVNMDAPELMATIRDIRQQCEREQVQLAAARRDYERECNAFTSEKDYLLRQVEGYTTQLRGYNQRLEENEKAVDQGLEGLKKKMQKPLQTDIKFEFVKLREQEKLLSQKHAQMKQSRQRREKELATGAVSPSRSSSSTVGDASVYEVVHKDRTREVEERRNKKNQLVRDSLIEQIRDGENERTALKERLSKLNTEVDEHRATLNTQNEVMEELQKRHDGVESVDRDTMVKLRTLNSEYERKRAEFDLKLEEMQYKAADHTNRTKSARVAAREKWQPRVDEVLSEIAEYDKAIQSAYQRSYGALHLVSKMSAFAGDPTCIETLEKLRTMLTESKTE